MAKQEVHLELLLSKRVLDASGESVGRIEEVRAKERGDEMIIEEFLLGPEALLERLAVWTTRPSLLRFLRGKRFTRYKVPWDKMDLSDPEQPRFQGAKQDLEALDETRSSAGEREERERNKRK